MGPIRQSMRGYSLPRLWRLIGFLGLVIGFAPGRAADLEELQGLVSTWISLQEAAHRADAEWQEQRPLLEARKELLSQRREQAQASLEARRERADALATDAARAAAALNRQRQELMALAGPIRSAQERLEALRPALPPPLRDSVDDAFDTLARQDAALTPETLPERLRLLFGLMTEIQQFGSSVHLVRISMTDPDGNTREMEVIYLGLGAAYAVSATDTLAAWGRPRSDGWEWTWDSSIAAEVRKAVRIFRKERTAEFVNLPLQLLDDGEGGAP